MENTILWLGSAAAFLLGSIPTGFLLTRAAGLGDIRQVGSGNIGATNVLRTGRKGLALLTLLGDAGKGILAVLLARELMQLGHISQIELDMNSIWFPYIYGVLALAGHMYTPWLGFKGGKGVATAAGILLALMPAVASLALLTWLIMAFLFRYSSLSAISATLLIPAYVWVLYHTDSVMGCPKLIFACVLAILVLNRHRTNFARLLAGTEDKMRFGNPKN